MGEDASIVVSVDDIKAFEKLKLISQMAPVKERIRSYETKHGCSLGVFEDRLTACSTLRSTALLMAISILIIGKISMDL